jgi:hypothetical protein
MSIKSIELKFSEVGMTAPDQPRKANYIPVAVLTFDNRKTKKRVYLEGMLEDKRSVNGYFGGQTFIVLHVDEEFRVFDLQGTFQGAVSAAEYGTPIDGGEDCFILCKGRTITRISDKGVVGRSRELADEEYAKYFPE